MRIPDDSVEILTAILYGTLVVLFSLMVLYGQGAVDNPQNFSKFILYAVIMLFPLVGRFGIVWAENNNVFEKYPSLQGFQYMTFHSPEQTWLGKNVPKVMQAKVLLPLSIIIALFFGAAVSINAQLAVGTPELVTGSISPGAELALAVEPAVFSETLVFNVSAPFIVLGGFYFFLYRRGVPHRWNFILSHFVSWLVSSLLFLIYHIFRYSGQESALSSILMQGLIYNGATLSTHSIIPAYTIHASGNFFSKASKGGIFTSETAILIVVLGTLVSSAVLLHFVFKELG